MNDNNYILACAADTHINSTVGLCAPVVNLDDGGTHRTSPEQRKLWNSWLGFNKELAEVKEKAKAHLIYCFVGDLGEKDSKYRSYQIITRNPATILRMMYDTLEPALELADQVLVIRGTEAHTGRSAGLEEAFAQDLGNVIREPVNDTASWWHARVEIGGVLFDIAHHASMGSLPWTEANYANRLAVEALWAYKVEWGERAPDVVIRAHQHRDKDSGGNFEELLAINIPGWQMKPAYIHRTTTSMRMARIGGVYFEIEKGKYRWTKRVYRPMRARPLKI